jgi:multisubunit Na+/H+ antiporter MnhC subunit
MNPRDLPDDDEPGFFRRNLVMILIGISILGCGVWAFVGESHVTAKPRLEAPIVLVHVDEQPEPPKPKPEIRQEPQQKEEDKILPAEIQPSEPIVDKKVEPVTDAPMTTAIAGADGSGLNYGSQGGGTIGGTSGMNGVGYSERSLWQSRFSRRLEQLLGKVPELKSAKGVLPLRVWLDETGRITRISFRDTTGNPKSAPSFDSQILIGQVIEPAPAGTPMPVHIRLSAR